MKQHYNYGIINGDTVKLFNDSTFDIHPLHDVALEDVNVELCDNGVLKIDAKEIQYDFYFHSNGRRIFEEDWQRTPHPKCIKEGKRHFWSKNKERYVNFGWVRTTETTPMQYILSKYKVEIYYYEEILRRFTNQGIEPQCMISAEAKEAMYDKTAGKVEPKFKVGDWIVFNGLILHIDEVVDGYYRTTSIGGIHNSYDWDIDNVARLWTIQDAKDGDVLVGSEWGVILMFRGIGNTEWDDVIDYHCYYDCCRECFIVQEDVGHWGSTKNNQLKPATKEQRDLLFTKMKEAGYELDDEKKELKLLITNGGDFFESENCEQKPAWSEEDEERLSDAIFFVREYQIPTRDKRFLNAAKEAEEWLKSLKERVGG